jgi:glycosyltransferase involved in cell wall biosynthesis
MLPKVSVITATYNSATTLSRTLESLKDQSYNNFEHIVVDGLSTDNTLDVIRESGMEDTLVDSRSDHGIYDALNRGIGLATGDVVGFLHSDDFFPDSNVLSKIARAFSDPSVEMCFGDLAYVRQEDTRRVVRRWKSGKFRTSRLKSGWMPPHPTFYVRREILKRYPFNLEYRISGDYDAMLRLLTREAGRVVYIPHELVHMRLGGASNKNLANILKKTREDWRVIRTNRVGGVVTLVSKNLRKLHQFFV